MHNLDIEEMSLLAFAHYEANEDLFTQADPEGEGFTSDSNSILTMTSERTKHYRLFHRVASLFEQGQRRMSASYFSCLMRSLQ